MVKVLGLFIEDFEFATFGELVNNIHGHIAMVNLISPDGADTFHESRSCIA